jgi:DNA-binding transcriptional ArsR family regulator
MMSASKLQKLLHTLSDINRLRIIRHLDNQEFSVGEIVEATGLSQPLASHHLKTLKNNGIVETRRKGPFIYYRLAMPELLEVLGILSEVAQNITDSDPTLPMFKCPSWWWNMHNIKR